MVLEKSPAMVYVSNLLRDSRHATLMNAITRLPLEVLQSL